MSKDFEPLGDTLVVKAYYDIATATVLTTRKLDFTANLLIMCMLESLNSSRNIRT